MPEDKKAHPGYFEYVPDETPQPQKVVVQRLEFESLPHSESHFESTLDTFHRLQNEVESFREELTRRKAEPYDTPKLGLDDMAVTIHTLSDNSSSEAAARALLGQVEGCKGAPSNGVTYSLYRGHDEQSPLLEMDRRVDELFRQVGPASSEPSMFAVMKDLQARLELADEFKLDAIYRRSKALVTEIDTLETPEQTTATQGQDQAKAQQIVKLSGVMRPLTAAAQEVPSVLSRIKTRKDTDEQAAQLLLRLKRLQTLNESATRMLLTDQQAILKVGSQMVANSKTMTSNLELLQRRLQTLHK